VRKIVKHRITSQTQNSQLNRVGTEGLQIQNQHNRVSLIWQWSTRKLTKHTVMDGGSEKSEPKFRCLA